MWEILTGQFFWGIVVGLVLSFFGAYLLALFNELRQNRHREKLIQKFCIDTIKNLQNTILEMDKTRDRARRSTPTSSSSEVIVIADRLRSGASVKRKP